MNISNNSTVTKFSLLPLRARWKIFSITILTAFLSTHIINADEEDDDVNNKITVTALKRSATLQETPISISALGEDDLISIGADDLDDYVGKVPGFNIVDSGPGNRRLVIRGIQGAGEAQVGLYYDEIPVTGAPGAGSDAGQQQPDIKLFDIERVEVLRGPQGTLYGSGTVGGTVRVISNKPDAGGFEAKVGTDISSTEKSGFSTQLNAMMNFPIIEDELAVRFVVYDRDIDGFIDNIAFNEERVNDEQTSGGRAIIRWTPNDDFTLTGTYMKQETVVGSGSHYQQAAGDLVSTTKTRDGFDDDITIFNITAEASFDIGDLVVSYSDFDRDVLWTWDSSVFPFPSPFEILVVFQPMPLEMNSFEARFSSDNDSAFNWTVGFFSSTRDADLDSNVVAGNTDGYPLEPTVTFFRRNDDTSLEQQSLFGEIYYDINDKLSLTLGARVFDIEFSKHDTTVVGLFGEPIADPETVASEAVDDGSIFKVNLGYEMSQELLIYGQISQGFRAGGANQTVVGQPIPAGYNSDSVTNYEVGIHSTWNDGDVTFNGAIYHLAWEDIQVQQNTPDNLFGYLSNAGTAQVEGIEVEFSWLASDNFELAATFNAVDARLTEDQPPVDIRSGLDGDAIPVVPDFTASFAAQYWWDLENGVDLSLRADINYTDSTNNNFRDFLIDATPDSATFGQETTTPNDRFTVMGAYAVANLRLSYDADTWGAALYVNNVADKRGVTYIQLDNFRPEGESHVIRPRTVGLSLYKTFD